MIPFRPAAKSEILRAARILHIRIESCHEGPFHPIAARFQQREVTLVVVLVAVLKGEVPAQPGDRIEVRATQTENSGPRYTAVPGVYSRLELTRGQEFVAFCDPDGTDAGQILGDPICFHLEAAETAALDVAFADAAGIPELRLSQLLGRLQPHRERFGVLFARYLRERLPEAFPDNEPDLVAVLEVIEAPKIQPATRFVLCDGAVEKFVVYPVAPALVQRFAQTLFRLLLLPEAADLHQNLAVTWIPNVVGITGSLHRISPDDVFAATLFRPAFAAAIESLADMRAGPLLAWLES